MKSTFLVLLLLVLVGIRDSQSASPLAAMTLEERADAVRAAHQTAEARADAVRAAHESDPTYGEQVMAARLRREQREAEAVEQSQIADTLRIAGDAPSLSPLKRFSRKIGSALGVLPSGPATPTSASPVTSAHTETMEQFFQDHPEQAARRTESRRRDPNSPSYYDEREAGHDKGNADEQQSLPASSGTGQYTDDSDSDTSAEPTKSLWDRLVFGGRGRQTQNERAPSNQQTRESAASGQQSPVRDDINTGYNNQQSSHGAGSPTVLSGDEALQLQRQQEKLARYQQQQDMQRDVQQSHQQRVDGLVDTTLAESATTLGNGGDHRSGDDNPSWLTSPSRSSSFSSSGEVGTAVLEALSRNRGVISGVLGLGAGAGGMYAYDKMIGNKKNKKKQGYK